MLSEIVMKRTKKFFKIELLTGIITLLLGIIENVYGETAPESNSLITQNIMIALNSRTTTDKLNECASMYPSPEEIKFTIIIDEDGNGVLSETEPQVHGLLKACFIKVVGSIPFPKTGKKLKVVYRIKLVPKTKLETFQAKKTAIEEVPRIEPEVPVDLNRGRNTSIVGMTLMGFGWSVYWGFLITAWANSDWTFLGTVISLHLILVEDIGGIVSISGLMTRRKILEMNNIQISPTPITWAWFTLWIKEIPMLVSGTFAWMELFDISFDEDSNNKISSSLLVYTLLNVFVLASFAIQIAYFLKLEKAASAKTSLSASHLKYIPIPSMEFAAESKTNFIKFSWFF